LKKLVDGIVGSRGASLEKRIGEGKRWEREREREGRDGRERERESIPYHKSVI